jgi:hypothetical protein
VNWPVRPSPPRSHHLAHGTLGIVYALAAVGQTAAREDLIALALAGAADVVSRNEAGADGFLVAHSDPPHRPEVVERYSLGWCNGPAGDAQVFRLLAGLTGDPIWTDFGDRCWTEITRSGLPRRIRPGFWDNNGRCCGTAGVLALACDRIVERGDDFHFADLLVDDLTERATIDEAGARWSNYEHRATRRTFDRWPDGPWAMRASFASSSGTNVSATVASATTRCSGPVSPPPLPTRRPNRRADHGPTSERCVDSPLCKGAIPRGIKT